MRPSILLTALAALSVSACATPSATAVTSARCADDAGWDDPAPPRRLHGSTWFVGTCGIAAVLVTSDAGHALIDVGTAKSADRVMDNIRRAGFRVEDIRAIVNTHAHLDHAGGIAAVKRASGAKVLALADAATTLHSGRNPPGDPQFGALDDFPAVARVDTIEDGYALRIGETTLTAHATPGHAPGGTSWTWKSCEAGRCVDIAFVDSLTAVSAPGYRFSDVARNPGIVQAFNATFDRVRALPCDLLITTHPSASQLWRRIEGEQPLIDSAACRRYADAASARLDARLAQERATP